MGKWDVIVRNLPKLDPLREESTAYRERVRKAKEGIVNEQLKGNVTSEGVVKLYHAQRDAVDEQERILSDCNVRLRAIEQLLEDVFGQESIDAMKVLGRSVRLQREPEPIVNDKPAAREWALVNMPDSLNVHPSTLKARVKELLQAGENPPEFVTIYARTKFVQGA